MVEEQKSSLSRIGKQPIIIPAGVEVTLAKTTATVKGSKGELIVHLFPDIEVVAVEGVITLAPNNETMETKAKHGLLRSLIQNAVTGVSEGFSKDLEIQGVGFKANLSGKDLKLQLGFSHEIHFKTPDSIELALDGLKIKVSGHDKQLVGQTAAKIRALKKPEPYKGKGIRYVDEYVIKKTGKASA